MLRSVSEALKPLPKIAPSCWAEKHLRLPVEGASGGRFDLSSRPYFREILDAAADPMTRRISIKGCAQLGKTTLLKAIILAMSVLDPSPGMLVSPDKEKTLELREELYAMADLCGPLKAHVPPKWRRNARALDFKRSYYYLAWSGGKQTLRGRSCKRVLATEIDVYQHDPVLGSTVELLEARTKAWFEHLILEESTPTDEDSLIDAQYEAGDQRRWYVECPHCGQHQELRFFPHKRGEFAGCGGVAGYHDEAGNLLDPEAARLSAHYVCLQGCTIANKHKRAMIDGGQWVPMGQEVDADGNLTGTPDRSARHRSYHLSGLLSDKETWGSMAVQYLTARQHGSLRTFFNNILGLKYSTRGKSATWEQLARRHAGSYGRGSVPAAADFAVCGADVQGGDDPRVYFVVRAFGPNKTSWLLDWGVLRPLLSEAGIAERNSDLMQLGAILSRRYDVVGGANALGNLHMAIRVQGVDTNFRMHDIHSYLQTQQSDRVRAMRGDHSVERAERYRKTLVERSARDGKPYEGGLELWGVAVAGYRDDLAERMSAEVDQPGAWYLPEDIIQAGGKDYLQQVTNTYPQKKRRPNGKEVREWVMRSKQIGDHYFACEVLASCLADMVVGGLGWDASQWPWRVPRVAKRASNETMMPREEGGFSAR